ncbi:MAG TPA: peptide chain release factor N(5)-glutamine methyltransferase [Elusimicrobiota bacterium]|nr:peptide chain release factor N(5)-glutamine methyltransferase [Elusimicrobiota bacterium]
MGKTLRTLLSEFRERLSSAGIENPSLEAEHILSAALKCRRLDLLLSPRRMVSETQHRSAQRLLESRLQRIPLAYVLGEWDFTGLTFKLNRFTLVPRPETELLYETVLRKYQNEPRISGTIHIADIGTGSGCLAISIAKTMPTAQVWAVDLSADAARMAMVNSRDHHVDSRVHVWCGDLVESISSTRPFDAVVANLPYIPTNVIPQLEPEVQQEPRRALDGGDDGLHLVRRLVGEVLPLLKSPGCLFLEIGYNQSSLVRELCLRAGFSSIQTVPDHSGWDRIILAEKK